MKRTINKETKKTIQAIVFTCVCMVLMVTSFVAKSSYKETIEQEKENAQIRNEYQISLQNEDRFGSDWIDLK